MTTSPTCLSLASVSKTFGVHRALADVSLRVGAAEIHGLVGENGSGKSTLIKILSGYHHPDEGADIRVDETSLRPGDPHAAHAAGLRFVHQDLALIAEMSTLENVGLTNGFPMSRMGIDWRRHRSRVASLLERVGVGFDLDRPVGELSAVERSAVAIARALDDSAGTPSLVVLDEPTAALPPAEVSRLFALVHEVQAAGAAVLYVSHRIDEVLDLTDSVTALRDGRVVGTRETATLDRASLCELIVGNDVQLLRPDAVNEQGEVVVEIAGLRGANVVGIDLSVRAGEVVGFAGLDGSGREDVASLIAGRIPGRVDFFRVGDQVRGELSVTAATGLGVALAPANRETYAGIRDFSVAENISLPSLGDVSRRIGLQPRRETELAQEWIRRLDIRPAVPTQGYASLSGGNRQKVILAACLNRNPALVVLDDPTSGVDIATRKEIYELVGDVSTRASVLVCSADLEDLVHLCHRVLVLVDGLVAEVLSGPQITEHALRVALDGHVAPAHPPTIEEVV